MLNELSEKLRKDEAVVCIVGAGYVGLPLAVAFARSGLKTITFDLNKQKIEKLGSGIDVTGELDNGFLKDTLDNFDIVFTSSPEKIREADFVILCVPTPVSKDKKPDLSYVESAAQTVGKNLKRGAVVVLESTVYPGVTEEILKPILERESGMLCTKDFSIGYSPERVNPGDSEHTLENVIKIVSGINKETAVVLEKLYGRIVKAGVFRARDIRTAEAAKVIENIQRDLNIALVNELAIIFRKMGLDSKDVLEAAATKWNFHKYSPGLVGGHCIPVDPYYLVYKAESTGYNPKIILAGREINDSMPEHVASLVMESLKEKENPSILLLGLAFKKNVRDTRNSPVKGIIKHLKERGAIISAYEPLLERNEAEREFGISCLEKLEGSGPYDCLMLVTDHDVFKKQVTENILKEILNPGAVIVDIRRMFDPQKIRELGFEYIGL